MRPTTTVGVASCILCAAVLLLLAGCGRTAAGPAGGDAPGPRITFDSPPPMSLDPDKRSFATLKTSKGEIRLELCRWSATPRAAS